MEEQKQVPTLENPLLITESAEDYQSLAVAEQGRSYQTTYTKKFKNRTTWTPPNPEEVKSFIPGTVHKISVRVGDYVCKNDELLVFEAMKMYNVIRAPFHGVVQEVKVREGERLPKGVVMLVVRPASETLKSFKKKARLQQASVKKAQTKKNVKKKPAGKGRISAAGKKPTVKR
ncbi:MAG: acetyl-CoA carboxylase biotin carboxyl carrier protein subunit [Prevotellaceae bacterium]|jgi:biotin carboxyl carrier protein|nr:acetyl-CoA carboxylase biotin carboxyl carrier protein subunit [Prevotellaceae bacterium]